MAQTEEEFEKKLKQMKRDFNRLAMGLTSSFTDDKDVIQALDQLADQMVELSKKIQQPAETNGENE